MTNGRLGHNEASVFEAILVSQAAVKQTGNVGMYTATLGPRERLDNIREQLVHLGDLRRDAVVDGAVADLDD